MDERDVEKALEEFKENIYVNRDLKQSLRSNFKRRRFSIKHSTKIAVAAVLCLIITGYSLMNFTGTGKVSAATLNVESYTSIITIGDGRNAAASENGGTIYMPGFGNGILAYDDKGLSKLYEGDVNFVNVSRDGKKIAFTEKGSIKIFNRENNTVDEILKGDNEKVFYEQLSWLPGGSGILYVKRVLEEAKENESMIKERAIYRYDFNTRASIKIGDGSYPSYIKGKNAIVFEREEKIVYKSLEDGLEKMIDEGSSPCASPDGRYIVFTKFDISTKEIKKNAYIEEGLQNIWIADTDNFNIKKRITSNTILKLIDEQEWLKSIKESDEPQILSHSSRFCYLYPTWTNDSRGIITVRVEYPSGDTKKRIDSKLIRINLHKEKLPADETVKNYLQAVASGDDDYISSLIIDEFTVEDMKGFNLTGYKVQRGSKSDYADVEVIFTREDNLYTRLEKSRYYTEDKDGKTLINGKKLLSVTELMADKGDIYMLGSGIEKVKLVTVDDLPKDCLTEETNNITSIAFNGSNLYFTLENGEGYDSIKVIEYNLNTKGFTILDSFSAKVGSKIGANRFLVDGSGELAVLDYYLHDNSTARSEARIYDNKNKKRTILGEALISGGIQASGIEYWDGVAFIIKGSSYGRTMRFRYMPLKSKYEIIK